MTKPRVLMISVSAGSGHVRAAQALLETAAQFDVAEVMHIDVMSYVNRGFRALYSGFYRQLILHAPAFWAYLYKKTDQAQHNDVHTLVRRLIERWCTTRLIKKVTQFQPDHIICTHFLPAELLSREIQLGRLTCPVWVQVTDFDLHRLWVQPHMSGYFAANEEVAYKLRVYGIPAAQIHVTGIAVAAVFHPQPKVRPLPGLLTVLVLSGGVHIGSVTEISARLLRRHEGIKVIAIAGNNHQQLAELQLLAEEFSFRLIPMGFSQCIEKWMALSDVVITKPGGLTSSECLIMGLPMLLVDPIPGQEERNGDFLLEHGAALKAHDMAGLEYKLAQLIDDPQRLAAMSAAMLAIAKPDAARQVLTQVLESR